MPPHEEARLSIGVATRVPHGMHAAEYTQVNPLQ